MPFIILSGREYPKEWKWSLRVPNTTCELYQLKTFSKWVTCKANNSTISPSPSATIT